MLWTFRLVRRRGLGEASELAGLSRTLSILPLSEITCLAHDQRVTSRFLQTIASGPNSHLPRAERRERREAVRSLRLQSDGSATRATTLLLFERAFPHRLTARFNRRWSRVISRLLAPSLDRKLAEGRSPESRLLLSARAHVLVSPANRQTLGHQWADLLAQAQRPPGLREPRAPINRASILGNELGIRALLDALVAQTPGHVRGIAMLSRLLSDGAGPLYNRQCSNELRGALLQVSAFFASSTIFPGIT
jgi:hypothetical protein